MRSYTLAIRLVLAAAFGLFSFGIASADVAVPGCDNGIGNAAQLQADVAAINANNEDDVIQLSAGCVYDLTATLIIAADGGHAVTVEGNGAVVSGNDAVRVFYVNSGARLTLNNLTVRDGALPFLVTGGGGIRNEGELVLNGTTVTGNSAAFGGGIYNHSGGSVTLNNSVVSANLAENGGGIENAANGTITINDSIVLGNSADLNGGGIRTASWVVMHGSTITGNTAGGDGGGYAGKENGRLVLDGGAVIANSASSAGGILNEQGAVATVTNSTIALNTARDGDGGGFYNSVNAFAQLNNVTLAQNSAAVEGGGLYVLASSTFNLSNSIIAGSISGGDCANGGILNLTGGNLIQDGTCAAEGVLISDPLLGALTGFPDYFPLLPGSPAIDSGANALCDPLDQRGVERPQDGDGNDVSTCDLGAFEADGVTVTPPVEIELLANGSFEETAVRGAIPFWTIKNRTGDKTRCTGDMPAPADGTCAFMFKGSTAENAKLTQVVDLSGVAFAEGDVLQMYGFFLGTNTQTKAKLRLSVKYAGNPTPVLTSLTVHPPAAYAQTGLAPVTIGGGTVEKIVLTVKNKSKAGKLYIDAISLLLQPAGTTRTMPLPLPAAPDTFRATNEPKRK